MNSKRLIYIYSVFLLILVSCKSTKTINTGHAGYDLTAKQLIKENSKKTPSFNTLVSRVKLGITEGDNSKSYTVSFRMEKGKTIWMSGGFGMVKALITPERVSFYNKLDNTYFDGDYSYISDVLGTELDFIKIQNLLIGEALFSLKEQSYDVSVHQDAYLLKPKVKPEAFELFYLLNPSHYKINSQQLAQPESLRLLQIDYTSYQEVEKQIFPEQIKVNAVEGNEETIIEIGFKSIKLNERITFPFKIPSGYDQIVLK